MALEGSLIPWFSVSSCVALYLQVTLRDAFGHKIRPLLLESADVAFVDVTHPTDSSKIESISVQHLAGKVNIEKAARGKRTGPFPAVDRYLKSKLVRQLG